MRYVLVDDSVPYDGYTPQSRPLGGAEKAVAGLAAALGQRQHEVTVLNRSQYPRHSEGVRWVPLDDPRTLVEADVLIAMRKPALLGTVRRTKHRLLWVVNAPDYLSAASYAPLWDSFSPALLFISAAQRRAYTGPLPSTVISSGVRKEFFQFGEFDPYTPMSSPLPWPAPEVSASGAPLSKQPHAVVTTHPLHGLSWLLDVWAKQIHPRLPEAKLAVFSAILGKGLKGEDVGEAIAPILAQVKAAAAMGVAVVPPRGDYGMAEVFRAARVHLYPGDAQDFACWTLLESQAAGMPAVARALGGTEERIANGQTGFIVPDAAAFANVAVEILTNDAVHRSLGEAAADPSRRRVWDMAADDVERVVATLNPAPAG